MLHAVGDEGVPIREVSAQITRDLLGWQPTRPGLIADLKEGHYFT